MFYAFPNTPTIIDRTVVSLLPEQSQLTFQEKESLQKADKYRADFTQLLTQEYIQQLKTGQSTIIQNQESLENYLKTNVDMMRILVIKHNIRPKFLYGLFISKKDKQYSTENNSIEESCGCEIVMVRYIYALAFNSSAFYQLQNVKKEILLNFSTSNSASLQQISQNLNCALTLLEFAQIPLHRLCNCMEDLLKSLITHQYTLIPELQMTVIVCFKNIIDCNANFFYLEKLRQLKDFDKMAKVCRASYSKLNESQQRLLQIQESVDEDIISYCNRGMQFYKIYGIWCILQINEKCIKYENYKQKNYIVLTSENFKIALELQKICVDLEAINSKDVYQQFTYEFTKICLLPTIDRFTLYIIIRIIALYGKGANQNVKNPDEIFMSLDSLNDYYEDKQKQIV